MSGLIWGAALAATASIVAADVRLIDAVRSRDTASVQALLKQRVDVNEAQGDGATALHWAVHLDDLPTVDLLLRAGARVNAANDLGVTPLYLACTNRHAAMVERLVAARANPNAALPNGETVLMNCARSGDAGSVRALLTHGANVNARESAHGQTALMWAAAQAHPGVVRLLLEAGADVKVRSVGYMQTVTSEVTQRAGREELNYTVSRGASTALLFAARSGDAESARLLVEAGADVNEALPNGTTALTLAAHSGHGNVGAVLLEKGADSNNADVGYTALHAAVLRSDLVLVKALLARGANPNVSMTRGTPMRRTSQDFDLPAALIPATPLLLAAKFLEPEILLTLAHAGADTRATMKDGSTALMLAMVMTAPSNADRRGSDRRGLSVLDGGQIEDESRVVQTVEALLSLGADVNAVSTSGDTAVHLATTSGYDTVIRRLVAAGASINVRNKRDQTPLGMLTSRRDQNERRATAEVLRRLGAVE